MDTLPKSAVTTGPSATVEGKEKLKLSILVADDVEHTRRMLDSFLRERFTDVKAVESGEASLKELMTPGQKFDIVLMDDNMGSGLTGLQVLEKIRSEDGFAKTPVVILASNNSTEKEIKSLGGVYFSKSLEMNELRAKIEELTQ